MKIIRTLIASLTLATAVGTLSQVAPASAATSVTFCFKWANNTAYASQPVQLFTSDSRGNPIAFQRNGRTAANGCATFSNTPSGSYLRVRAFYTTPPIWSHYDAYVGWTPLISTPGSGGANLGTGFVYYAWSI